MAVSIGKCIAEFYTSIEIQYLNCTLAETIDEVSCENRGFILVR